MVRRQGLIIAIVVAIACQKPQTAVAPKSAGPQVRATVVTIRTTIQRGGQAPSPVHYTHSLMIANNLARSGDEVDAWRLFDLKRSEVTFVDDIAKTYRKQPVSSITSRRPPDLPAATWTETPEKKNVNGFDATKAIVRMGGYQREIWFSDKTAIPPELFSMMSAVQGPEDGIAGPVNDALSKVRGFPVADHAELPFGDKKLVVDRTVLKIEQKNVPESWFRVPRDYRDVTVKAPAASRRPAS